MSAVRLTTTSPWLYDEYDARLSYLLGEPDIPSEDDLVAERMDEDRERREREVAERERVLGHTLPVPGTG